MATTKFIGLFGAPWYQGGELIRFLSFLKSLQPPNITGIYTSLWKFEQHTYQPLLCLIFANASSLLTREINFPVICLSDFILLKLKVFKHVCLNHLIFGNNLVLMHHTFLRYWLKWPLLEHFQPGQIYVGYVG